MLSLIDRILADGLMQSPAHTREHTARISEVSRNLRSAQRFSVDNCYDYLIATKQQFGIKEYPSLMPPFDVTWYEWRDRSYYDFARNDSIAANECQYSGGVSGVLVTVERSTPTTPVSARYPECHAMVTFSSMSSDFIGDKPWLDEHVFKLAIDTKGGFIGYRENYIPSTDYEAPCWAGREAQRDEMRQLMHELHGGELESNKSRLENLSPAWMAIAMCHCKNVRQIEQNADLSDLGKKWLRKNNNPKFTYRVLEIGGLSQSPQRPTISSGEQCPPKALHIVRGNFATYTAEKPLFGHIVGTVWRPSHARGDIKAGAVLKDYSVKAPELVTQ